MKFINIAEEQLKTKRKQEKVLLAHQDFFEEYFAIFEDKTQFQKNINCILNKINYQQTMENINILKERLSNLIYLITSNFNNIVFPDIIFFIGPGNCDGHGILIKGKPFTFFDMSRMNSWMSNSSFALEIHLLHEVFHAIHYYYSSEFYPRNYNSVEEQYIKRMIAEGLATYLSKSITKSSLAKSLWLDLLDEKFVKKWMKRCENSRKLIWHSIKKSISSNREDESLLNTLFSVPRAKSNLLIARLGYYFGVKIVERAVQDLSLIHI